jgi:hypothetical protein
VAVSKTTILHWHPHTAASDKVQLHARVLMLHQPTLLTMLPVTALLYESCLLTVHRECLLVRKMYAMRWQQRLLCANSGCQTVYYCVMLCWFPQVNSHTAGPGGRTVYGVGLQPLARIVGSHPADSTNRACVAQSSSACEGLMTRKEEYYGVCWSNCVLCRNLKKRRPRPDLG